MSFVLAIWGILCFLFLGIQGSYYMYLWRVSRKPWNLRINKTYMPQISVIVPLHNEEKTIEFKLQNLCKVKYPKEKMQIILVNDASTDKTLEKVHNFLGKNHELNTVVLSETEHHGKSYALNIALKQAKHDIIIVSDADTFWSPDILIKALPFLSDPSVGAVSGRQILFNSRKSLLTQTEKNYLNFTYNIIKLGESKVHSTILFHGLFSAYKRKFLKQFNLETDDSGTALDIIQNGARTIYVPGTKCYEIPPLTWKGKIRTKFRRASQLIGIYVRCLKLLLKKRLIFPRRIAIVEIFIYLINPIIFLLLIFTSVLFLATHLNYLLYTIVILLFLLAAITKFRLLFVEALQDNCILLLALFTFVLGKKFLMWETLEESRSMLSEEMLKKENLI